MKCKTFFRTGRVWTEQIEIKTKPTETVRLWCSVPFAMDFSCSLQLNILYSITYLEKHMINMVFKLLFGMRTPD